MFQDSYNKGKAFPEMASRGQQNPTDGAGNVKAKVGGWADMEPWILHLEEMERPVGLTPGPILK